MTPRESIWQALRASEVVCMHEPLQVQRGTALRSCCAQGCLRKCHVSSKTTSPQSTSACKHVAVHTHQNVTHVASRCLHC